MSELAGFQNDQAAYYARWANHADKATSGLVAILLVASLAIGVVTGVLAFHTRTLTTTRTVHDKPSYGTYKQTISGTQIGLRGGVCDVYETSSVLTLRCHQ